MKLEQFNFSLPTELIAQIPAKKRDQSRLLVPTKEGLKDQLFSDLPRYFNKGDLLIRNNTKVVKARLLGQRKSGGKIEVMIEHLQGEKEARAFIRASHRVKQGEILYFDKGVEAEVIAYPNSLATLNFNGPLLKILNHIGVLPLPPYIHRQVQQKDETRSQTVFAKKEGAVAAPTAALHFTKDLFASLQAKGVKIVDLTLHVGAGTFAPVRTDDIRAHVMHKEWFTIPLETMKAIAEAQRQGRLITAVGTTSLRAVESAAQYGFNEGDTGIFIYPGYQFKVVDRLITNFHLPKSTLLMLVSAFYGLEETHALYRYAIKQRYRFFSYGDAMLLDKKPC